MKKDIVAEFCKLDGIAKISTLFYFVDKNNNDNDDDSDEDEE